MAIYLGDQKVNMYLDDSKVLMSEFPQPEPQETTHLVLEHVGAYRLIYHLKGYSGQDRNVTIDWGDGTVENVIPPEDDDEEYLHQYATTGNYTVEIKGNLKRFMANGWDGDASTLVKILDKSYFGSAIESVPRAFMSSSITSIPDGLFRKATKIKSFYGCFSDCGKLASIPESLFSNNLEVTSFDHCFSNCNITSIPESLFSNNLEVVSFYYCFEYCGGLTSIPEDLFSNNLEVLSFYGCFSGCGKLASIPESLFSNNTKVTSFYYCFYSCISLTSSVPELWLRTNPRPTGTRCFYRCNNALNYAEIPSSWK